MLMIDRVLIAGFASRLIAELVDHLPNFLKRQVETKLIKKSRAR